MVLEASIVFCYVGMNAGEGIQEVSGMLVMLGFLNWELLK